MSRRHTYSSILSRRRGSGWATFYTRVTLDNESDKCVSVTHHDVALCGEWQQAGKLEHTAFCCCICSLFYLITFVLITVPVYVGNMWHSKVVNVSL